jgi:Holliday junction resolvasome RuvABC endonuclease subunit
MTVVGLDLSLTSTGICIDGVAESLSSQLKGVERLADLAEQVCQRVSSTPHAVVCVEGYSFGSRNSQAHAIGELGGVVRYRLWQLGTPVVDIPPTCRAKFATGRGNAGKDEVVSAISARTGIVWAGKGANDRCDAWILEEMGRTHFNNQRYEWPQVNLSAMDKVDWSPFTSQ